jgi:NitT/TauT family transport system permease protein
MSTLQASPSSKLGVRRGSLRYYLDRYLPVASLRILALIVVLGGWQFSAATRLLNPLFVSEPSSVVLAFLKDLDKGTLLTPLGATLYETLVGFLIGSLIGNVLAFLLYELPIVEKAMHPFLTAVNNLPRFALAPLLVLWFGLGSVSRIALVVSLVFFIAFLNTYTGLRSAERDHLLLGATLGASRVQMQRLFIIPSALPSVFAGLQLSLTYSFLTAVVAEMLSGGAGVGAQLVITASSYEMDQFFAFLLALVIVSTVLAAIMRMIEAKVLSWRTIELRGLSH